MDGPRYLLVTADDFGIGPDTTRGILELAAEGLVTASVLLVTAPHAEAAVRAWRQAGAALELGWHPCLTLDAPVLPPGRVPSLVTAEGRFHGLAGFLRRLVLGQVRPAEIEAELRAQRERFVELTGGPPLVVNAHHHLHIFRPVGDILRDLLRGHRPRPYLRNVREPWWLPAAVPGARCKRAFLSLLGRAEVRRQGESFPGNDWLAGITDPAWLTRPDFFARWLARVPGRVVELTCHPGYPDRTLMGRDCPGADAQFWRRVRELRLLRQPAFRAACRQAGFTLIAPSGFMRLRAGGAHAA